MGNPIRERTQGQCVYKNFGLAETPSHKGQHTELEKQINRNSHMQNLPSSWVAVTSESIVFVSEKKAKEA